MLYIQSNHRNRLESQGSIAHKQKKPPLYMPRITPNISQSAFTDVLAPASGEIVFGATLIVSIIRPTSTRRRPFGGRDCRNDGHPTRAEPTDTAHQASMAATISRFVSGMSVSHSSRRACPASLAQARGNETPYARGWWRRLQRRKPSERGLKRQRHRRSSDKHLSNSRRKAPAAHRFFPCFAPPSETRAMRVIEMRSNQKVLGIYTAYGTSNRHFLQRCGLN